MTSANLQRTDAERALIAAFESAPPRDDWRKAAFAHFAQKGLPHRRVEEWHYTDLRNLMRAAAPFRAPDAAAIAAARNHVAQTPFEKAFVFVTLDGAFQADLSARDLPAGLRARPLAQALLDADAAGLLQANGQGDADPIVALNAALMQDGIVIDVADGVALDRPIVLFNLLSKGAAHAAVTRSAVRVGADAKVEIVEFNENAGDETQSNDALVLAVGDGADVQHVVNCEYRGGGLALQSLIVKLGAKAAFHSFAFVRDSALVRRQIFACLAGEYSKLSLNGLSLLRGNEHADTTLVVDHAVPHCESREFFRHILDGEATGVYQGKVSVRPLAQKTDGAMKSQAIVLAEGAAMFNKPELEIFADDVVCGHGATVGQLDEDQIFYLQARGLPKAEAEAMLLEAFANAALEGVESETTRDAFAGAVGGWLQSRARRS